MDQLNVTTLPVEIALLIAEQLATCRDVLSLMQVYLVSKVQRQKSNRLFRQIMFRIDSRNLLQEVVAQQHPSLLELGLGWAILNGDTKLARLALIEYHYMDSGFVRRLWKTKKKNKPRALRIFLCPFSPSWNQGKLSDPTPEMLAVLSGNIDMLKLVFETWIQGRDKIGTIDESRRCTIQGPNGTKDLEFDDCIVGVSALTLAAHQGRLDMIQLLVDKGAIAHWTQEIPRRITSYSDSSSSDSESWGEYFDWMDGYSFARRYDLSIIASICDWGVNLPISEKRQSGRMEVLRYFLDKGRPVDGVVGRLLDRVQGTGCFHSTHYIPGWFTPLYYTTWALKPELVPHAQLLIRRGAKCAPSTTWKAAPWGRGSICPPGWRPNWAMSPLEWVLRGGECTCGACKKNEDEPDPARLEVEQTLFKTMMEEGVEKPTTPDQLRSALEIVIHAHTNRAFRRHSLLRDLCQSRVRYSVEKGARLGDLDEDFSKAMKKLGRLWDKDLSILASLQTGNRTEPADSVEATAEAECTQSTRTTSSSGA